MPVSCPYFPGRRQYGHQRAAFRGDPHGMTARLGAVNAALDVNCAGAGRSVELVVLALSLALGQEYPKIARLDVGSITLDVSAAPSTVRTLWRA